MEEEKNHCRSNITIVVTREEMLRDRELRRIEEENRVLRLEELKDGVIFSNMNSESKSDILDILNGFICWKYVENRDND